MEKTFIARLSHAFAWIALALFALCLTQMAQAADHPQSSRKVANEWVLGFDNIEQAKGVYHDVKRNSYGQIECRITLVYESGEERTKLVSVRKNFRQAMSDCGNELDHLQSAYQAAKRSK